MNASASHALTGHPATLLETWSSYNRADARAVCSADGGPGVELTRGRLERSARLLGARLGAEGIGPGDVVAVLCGSRPEAVVAMLGIAQAGAAFALLDGTTPAERLEAMLAQVNARVVAVLPHANPPVRGLIAVEVELATPGSDVPPLPVPPTRPEDLAYVVFTSGSTGTPKAVGVSHGAFTTHVRAVIDLLRLDDTSVALQFAGMGFDVALEEIWPTLAVGGRVVMRGDALWSAPELLALSDREGITVWQLPTAYWTALVADLTGRRELSAPARLSTVVIGSEAADLSTARRWLDSPLGSLRLINGYGPAEGVITATAWDSTAHALGDGPYLPLGTPLAGRAAVVVDESLREVPPGRAGEVCLTGPCLAWGYFGGPEANERAFRTLPDGRRAFRTGDLASTDDRGVLHFLGRRDRQVKIEGVRVEPGDVEAALLGCDGVVAAAVVDIPSAQGRRLVAHLVCPAGEERVREIRRDLRGLVPTSMVPAVFLRHDGLPTTVNGKVDHAALRRLGAGTSTTTMADSEEAPMSTDSNGRSRQDQPDANPDRTARLLANVDVLATRLARKSTRELSLSLVEFHDALAAVLSSPDEAKAVPGFFDLEPLDNGSTAIRVAPEAEVRLWDGLSGLDDPAELSTAIRLLLDASTRLQQVSGGGRAAEELMGMGANLVPVHESIAAGMHPRVGAAAALLSDAGNEADPAVGSRIASWLADLESEELTQAVRGLTALAEAMLAEDDASAGGALVLQQVISRIHAVSA